MNKFIINSSNQPYMLELYENLGFKENPFSKFSAEEELSYINMIYFEPKYFKTLYDDIKKNNSRFIFGQRGSGKTALMYKIISKIKEENHLFILIDDFSFLSKVSTFKDYQIVFIKQLLKTLVTRTIDNKRLYKDLSDIDKEKFAFIISVFFETLTNQQFKKVYEFCQTYNKTANILRKIYNNIFNRLINNLLSGVVVLTGDLVRRSLSLPKTDPEGFYREYLPTLKESDELPKNPIEFINLIPPEQMNHLFSDVTSIIQKLGFKATIIFIDKVDETSEIKGNVEEISKKLIPLLTENRLIISGSFAFVFMLWSKLKPELESNYVRFDKIKPVDISWTTEELKSILQKRLKYFSNDKEIIFENLIEDNRKTEIILSLAYGSPRDLLMVLSSIYDAQQDINSDSKFLSDVATTRGIKKFLESYPFYTIYPPTKTGKEDIKRIIAKLVNLGRLQFQITDVASSLKICPPAATSYVKIWKNYGIIKEIPEATGQAKSYLIDDPKIEYMVKEKIHVD